MSFYGNTFTFDGQSCADFGLMMYDIDNKSSNTNKVISGKSVVEDSSNFRWKSYFYGTNYGDKLSFDLIFGVNIERIESHRYLDRTEIHNIAAWLTSHNQYKYLEIDQDDMLSIRYRCIITSLEVTEYDLLPYTLKATVECDSQFAYMLPQTFRYAVDGYKKVQLYNYSAYDGYYYPKMEITLDSNYFLTKDEKFAEWKKYYTKNGDTYTETNVIKGNEIPTDMYYERGNFSIINYTDESRLTYFAALPSDVTKIVVDNDKNLISCNDGQNIYPYFNYKFFRLNKGNNSLGIYGNGSISITCEFPVCIGG